MAETDSLFEFRDWAHLPPEIVELISEKVKYIVDYVRFRAVCSPWRAASPPKPRHLPPQLPWLMLPYDGYSCGKNDGTLFFYDVWESKMRKVYLPDTSLVVCSASCRGWFLLVSYKGRDISLLNPLTGSEIELPPFSSWFDPYMINFGMSRMTFSSDLTDPDCLITVFLETYWVLYCRVGDPCWTRYDLCRELADATYYNGRLYLLYEGDMVIIEPGKPEEHIKQMDLEWMIDFEGSIQLDEMMVFEEKILLEPELTTAVSKRFVEGKSGVYVVGVHPEEKFELYQFQDQQMKFKKITGTRNNTAIFYGREDSYPCLALSSDDWDSLDGGSLYMENKFVPDACIHAVKSGYDILSVQRYDGHLVLDHADVKEPEFELAVAAMWFQPSYF